MLISQCPPVKKNKLNTFMNIIKINNLFSKIAIISQKHSIGLKSLFSYPVKPLSMSLAAADGPLKTPKPVLLHKLAKDVEPATEYVFIWLI